MLSPRVRDPLVRKLPRSVDCFQGPSPGFLEHDRNPGYEGPSFAPSTFGSLEQTVSTTHKKGTDEKTENDGEIAS